MASSMAAKASDASGVAIEKARKEAVSYEGGVRKKHSCAKSIPPLSLVSLAIGKANHRHPHHV